jgi:hypothetical protein
LRKVPRDTRRLPGESLRPSRPESVVAAGGMVEGAADETLETFRVVA